MANKDFMDPELTEEEKKDMIIENEEDYLEGLLAAADDAANDIKKIDIIRNERKYFSFSIHALSDELLKDIRKNIRRLNLTVVRASGLQTNWICQSTGHP